MNVALFGGTFDPIHLGHVAVARAAQKKFKLGRVYFVPADVPPHKTQEPVSRFIHRYAMLTLALAGEKTFVPSLLEFREGGGNTPNYSIETVRRLKRTLKKIDRLFFLIGIDAFMEIATWRQPEDLLRECEFIVASRPGFSLAQVAEALPESLRPSEKVAEAFRDQAATGGIVLQGATIHLLDEVHDRISATQIRAAAARKRPLDKFVGPQVSEYIKKVHLYEPYLNQPRETRHGNSSQPTSDRVAHVEKRKFTLISGGAAPRGHSEER